MNKASGGDGITVELLQILKDDAVKVLHSICQQIWKTQQQPQDWKGQFSQKSQRKEMPRMFKLPHNCTYLICWQSNAQKFPSQASTVYELSENFQMFKLDLEKTEEPDEISNIHWIIEKTREFQKKHLLLLH